VGSKDLNLHRRTVQRLQPRAESHFQIGIALIASGVGGAFGGNVVHHVAEADLLLDDQVRIRRQHRLQHQAADPLGMIAQQRERNARSIGGAIDVQALDVGRRHQVDDVLGGRLAVVGGEAPPLRNQPVAAGVGILEHPVDPAREARRLVARGVVIHLRAVQIGFCQARAAHIHQNEIALLHPGGVVDIPEPVLDAIGIQSGIAARPAIDEQHRIIGNGSAKSLQPRHRQADLAAIGGGAILGHIKIGAGRHVACRN
jgi:hypothetical protein